VSTFDRLNIAVFAALALSAFAGIDCGGASGDCFRYSDCASGLTCSAGKCVVPPPQAPSDDGSDDAGTLVTDDAETTESTPVLGDEAQSGDNGVRRLTRGRPPTKSYRFHLPQKDEWRMWKTEWNRGSSRLAA
jgi:hypothetical protein